MTMNRRQFIYTGTGALAGAALSGCGRDAEPTLPAASSSQTYVFRNGVILPVDQAFSEHSTLAIRDGRVLAIGADDAVLAQAGRGTTEIDLDGRFILPGFVEPHMHFALMAGLGHLEDIGPFERATFDDALKALARIRENAGPDDWVMGRQFDPILLEPPRDLTTRDLDPVVPDRPVFVLNASGHIAYVNSRALELAGITRDTDAPPGGEYGRYEDSSPNGVLYGTAAHTPVLLRNEQITQRMATGFVAAGRELGEKAVALGITTLCDQATGAFVHLAPPYLQSEDCVFTT